MALGARLQLEGVIAIIGAPRQGLGWGLGAVAGSRGERGAGAGEVRMVGPEMGGGWKEAKDPLNQWAGQAAPPQHFQRGP